MTETKPVEIQPPTKVGEIFETRLESFGIFRIGKQPSLKDRDFSPMLKLTITRRSRKRNDVTNIINARNPHN